MHSENEWRPLFFNATFFLEHRSLESKTNEKKYMHTIYGEKRNENDDSSFDKDFRPKFVFFLNWNLFSLE